MFRKSVKIIILIFFSVIIILGLVYLGLGYYYEDSFSCGTRINGIYCTGHTPEEVKELLAAGYEYDGLDVCDADGRSLFYLDAEDMGFSYDFGEALDIWMSEQNPWLWPADFISGKDHELEPAVTIDEASLDRLLDARTEINDSSDVQVSLDLDDGAPVLHDNSHRRPDRDRITEKIKDALYASESSVQLDDTCYYDAQYTSEQEKTVAEYEAIEEMLDADITYCMGDDRENIGRDTLASFLKKDEDGRIIINDSYVGTGEDGNDGESADSSGKKEDEESICTWDDEAIDAWVDDLADRYDSVGAERKFTTAGGDTITISGGIYGNKIDRSAEKKYLRQAVRDNLTEDHEPEYLQKALKQGRDDIGDTYVEVNMTDQVMYYFENGKKVLETPVVTGNLLTGSDTPEGTNYVYFKQKNRTLIGPNYQTFVKYWIAVKGHIGIHDASWRSTFGGDIYRTGGSHGCINTPTDAVSRLYDMVEIGTPVVMYYTESR